MKVSQAHASGVVVGVSGGIDSAVVASLCKTALGPKKVTGLFLFEDSARASQDMADAKTIAEDLAITTHEICITPVIDAIQKVLAPEIPKLSRIALANIKARARMVILYAFANQRNLLVAGTGDKSEGLIGYYTKYGDGGVDFLPIGHLYKTEVRALGTKLRLPYNVVTKPSSPNLWPGQKASDEIPADYDVLDRVLTLLFDRKLKPEKIAKMTGTPNKLLQDIVKLNRKSEHKRQIPDTPK